MNSKMAYITAFMIGAAAGGAIVLHVAKARHEEEIRSVKETYSRREAVMVKPADDVERSEQQRRESVVKYAEMLRKEKYLPGEGEKQEELSSAGDTPYTISPDEFGEMDGYEKISLTYYSDGTLADDADKVIEDAVERVGSDFRDHFGEYEEDSVFVRNDKLKCDYEILMERRSYSDILKFKPYLRREE